MKQLTGADANFLYMETDTNFGHVTGLYLYAMPDAGFDPLAAVRAKYGSLVGQLEPLRRRLVEVPFGLDHPYWIADPAFDLDFHVRALNLAPPGAWSSSTSRSPGSSAGPWTGPGRSGRSTSSRA